MLKYKLKKSLKKACQNIFRAVSGIDNKKTTSMLSYNLPALNCIPQYQIKFHENRGKYGDVRNLKRLKLYCPSWNDISLRRYSTAREDNFPSLTDLPVKSYPGLFTDIQNFLITHLTIRQQLDPEFSTREFLATTKKVVQMVSNRLAQGDVDYLEDLVTEDVFNQIKRNLPKFSPNQRQDLIVTENELLISFLRDMSIYYDSATNGKVLQILTVHHLAKGMEEVKKVTENFSFQGPVENNQIKINPPRIYILNYRFIRKFTSIGKGGDWTINALNHVPSSKAIFSLF